MTGRWRPKEERMRLGKRAVFLRDDEKLQWKDVAESLGLLNETQAIIYYKKYKESAKGKIFS